MTSSGISSLDALARRFEQEAEAYVVAHQAWCSRFNTGLLDNTLHLLIERSDFLSTCAKTTRKQLEALARQHNLAIGFGTYDSGALNLYAVWFRPLANKTAIPE